MFNKRDHIKIQEIDIRDSVWLWYPAIFMQRSFTMEMWFRGKSDRFLCVASVVNFRGTLLNLQETCTTLPTVNPYKIPFLSNELENY